MPDSNIKHRLVILLFIIIALVIFGLLWAFLLGPSEPGGFGWYLFSYAMGLTMIVLPCTLPLAFVIVPLSMGKGPAKGFGMALAFGLGVTLTLSLYGVLAAIVGKVALGSLNAPLETVKNWVYFIAGIFAYLFALGEVGLLKFHLPTYTGAAPAFIQKQQDFLKALLLGMFLGNIGVGCPHPATPLILTEIASSGNIFYGWSLFFVHAVGRVLPLLLLALLGILGVNALNWLVAHKAKIERGAGWAMVFVAGFILVLGLFTHAWWVDSGMHTSLEALTQENRLLTIISARFGGGIPHHHGLETGTSIFGQPLAWGSWVLAILWIVPLFWYYFRKRKESTNLPDNEKLIERRITPWRLSFLIALSAFLVVAFVYFLPLRFLRQAELAATTHHDEMPMTTGVAPPSAVSVYQEEAETASSTNVHLSYDAGTLSAGTSTTLYFLAQNDSAGLPIDLSQLELEHTKLMHVIGVRNDLSGFLHIHPEPTGVTGQLATTYTWPAGGNYKLWSEILYHGTHYTVGHPPFYVAGEPASVPEPVTFERQMTVQGYEVHFNAPEILARGAPMALNFEIHDPTGAEAALGDYLGAPMHLAVIKDDWRVLIHIHPTGHSHSVAAPRWRLAELAYAHGDEEGGTTSPMMAPMDTMMGSGHGTDFAVTFPEAGRYKLFAQFRPVGLPLAPDQALVASFWVQVTDQAPTTTVVPPASGLDISWGVKLAVSLVLILLLSWGIKKIL